MPKRIDCSKKSKYNCKNIDAGDSFFKVFDDTMPEMKSEVAKAGSEVLDENIVGRKILNNINKVSDRNAPSILYQTARKESGIRGQLSDALYMCNKNYNSKNCPKSNSELTDKFEEIQKDNSIQQFTNLKEGYRNTDLQGSTGLTTAATNIAASSVSHCNRINIDNIMQGYIHDLSNTYVQFLNNVDIYSSIFRDVELIQSVKNEKNKEIKKVTYKINDYKQFSLIDGRKIYHSDEEYKRINFIYKIIIFFYYFVFGFAIIASNYIGKRLYNNRIILLLTILYIIFPFFIRHFVIFIVSILVYIIEKFSIEKDVVSYNDIIEEKNK